MAFTGITEAALAADECQRVFGNMAFFDVLSADDIAALSTHMRARDYVPGATIFYEDDESDAVYFLADGAIEIFKSDQSGKKLPLAILRDNGLLGEMGLLNNIPRSATARALSQTRCLYLSSSAFTQGLTDGDVPTHRLVLAFSRILSHRLCSMDERLFLLFENTTDNDHFREVNEWKQRLLATWTGLSLESHV